MLNAAYAGKHEQEVIPSKTGKAHRLAHRPPDWDAVNPPATNNFYVT